MRFSAVKNIAMNQTAFFMFMIAHVMHVTAKRDSQKQVKGDKSR